MIFDFNVFRAALHRDKCAFNTFVDVDAWYSSRQYLQAFLPSSFLIKWPSEYIADTNVTMVVYSCRKTGKIANFHSAATRAAARADGGLGSCRLGSSQPTQHWFSTCSLYTQGWPHTYSSPGIYTVSIDRNGPTGPWAQQIWIRIRSSFNTNWHSCVQCAVTSVACRQRNFIW